MRLSSRALLALLGAASAFTAPGSLSSPRASKRQRRSSTTLFYGDRNYGDGSSSWRQPNDHHRRGVDAKRDDAWNILKNTQQWMKDILFHEDAATGDPLSRREVSYVCEVSSDQAMILANIFRKLKEARQVGSKLAEETKGDANQQSLQKTQVLVIPANQGLTQDFQAFDNLVEVINNARRNSRDFVTDESFAHLYKTSDWKVEVNCAHLHPKYGDTSSMAFGMDVNLKANLDERSSTRRSPFPTIVVEVCAGPSPPETVVNSPPPPPSSYRMPPRIEDDQPAEPDYSESDPEITLDVVQQLEELFRKPTTSFEGGMYDYTGIGKQVEEFSPADAPMARLQQWVSANDDYFEAISSAFTITDSKHVDEAFEFVFCNLAMQSDRFLNPTPFSNFSQAQTRQYIIMPDYMRSSAVSFDKFTSEVRNIIRALPDLENKVEVTMFHPEHVNEDLRAPEPTVILQWLV